MGLSSAYLAARRCGVHADNSIGDASVSCGVTIARTQSGAERVPGAAKGSHRRATLPRKKCAVPSPMWGLTSVFGMGTGVAPTPRTVGKTACWLQSARLVESTALPAE